MSDSSAYLASSISDAATSSSSSPVLKGFCGLVSEGRSWWAGLVAWALAFFLRVSSSSYSWITVRYSVAS